MMRQISSLLLVLFILCVASSNTISTKVVDVDIICKEAPNQSYCSNLLNSKPGGAKGVDLDHLTYYTIDVLNQNWTRANDLIISLVQRAENATVANYYHRCSFDILNNPDGSVGQRLADAQVDLFYGRYPAVAKDSDDVMKYILDCIDSLHKNQTSPLLGKYVDDIRQGAQVLQVISKYLNLGK